MVSLNRDFNTSRGGGVFFNDVAINDDDTQRLQPVFGDVERTFVPLKTVTIVALQLVLCIGVMITTIVLAVAWPEELDRCAPFFIILYIHAAYWCISLIVDCHVKQKHHTLRINGYLEFYRQTHDHSRMPFYVVSFWNTILLILSTIFHHLYEDFQKQCLAGGMKAVYHLCIVIGVETLILVCIMALYIHKVIQFNRSKPPPDVLREEWMMSFIQDSYSGGEIGYREPGDHIHDLLEKQADLIRYLVDRNAKLSHKIMMLTGQINRENP